MTISIDKSIEKEKENAIQTQKRQPTYEINPLILNRWSPRSMIGGALPLFQDGGGSIILNASIAASKGVEASSVYSATKAAIRSFAFTELYRTIKE
jgi:NAD(P)-dependent dehydrogenase (short-subunit alcohol dehydrogenase family)